MRKEDKVRLPPRLKVKLPDGFHIERKPDEYILYASYPVVDEEHRQTGTMTDLMCVFPASFKAEYIETYALDAAERLKKKLEHTHEGESRV